MVEKNYQSTLKRTTFLFITKDVTMCTSNGFLSFVKRTVTEQSIVNYFVQSC